MFLVHSRLPKELLVSFEAEFGPYEGEIARLSQEVRDEASLASKQAQKQENELQAIERLEAKQHRQSWTKFKKDYHASKAEENNRHLEINRCRLEKKRFEALDALSTYTYQKTYRQIRKECVPERFLTKQHIDLGTVENQDKIACDIHTFIRTKLEEWLEGETPELQINDPTLIITISDRLEKGAQGMFLWVKFQLYTLLHKRSDKLILAALNDLPRDLPETFRRILCRYTEADDIDIGREIFRWIAVAKRPLTVEELREAIGTKPLQETWSDNSYINDMKKAMACCGNLVFIEEEQQTVHFTHGSVKQYLLSDAVQESLSKHFVDLRKADGDAGAVCVTYLNFPIFNQQVARKVDNSISATDITTTVVKNSLPLGQFANKIALSLLRRGDKTGKSIHHLLKDAAGDIDVNRQQNSLKHYPFLPYAKQFWLEHTKQGIDPYSMKLRRLWRNLIVEASWRDTLSGVPWTLEDWENRAASVLQWIVEQNHCSLAQLILGSDVELTQPKLLIFVKGAATRGHARLIEISLGSEKVSQIILDLGLQAAAAGGHLDVVERLRNAGAK
ncbi:MAG: hypothetical protein Q9201_001715 [Fulgogasparrea decipioides]